MKIKLPVTCWFLFILFASSCKKETVPAITGKWMNTAIYSDPASGGYGWETVSRFHEFLNLEPGVRFNIFTDIPVGSGVYRYENASKVLQLEFQADHYGTTARSEMRKVEVLTNERLIISFVSPLSGIRKTEYIRSD